MVTRPVHPAVTAVLEFGPIIAFLVAYFVYRNETWVVGPTEYSGFVAVTAAFVPVFLMAIAATWFLSGRLARMQVVVAGMLVVFGGLSVWMNNPAIFKMKPTVAYLVLAAILGIGLLRGQYWLKFLMDEMVPMTDAGWKILTKRVTALFLLSAAANELVWRTQSEAFWVLFETIVMPIVVLAFFLGHIGLVVDHATFKASKKRPRSVNRDRSDTKTDRPMQVTRKH